MSYALLKTVHVSCVGLSFTLFFLRGWWIAREAAVMRQRWVRIVPHLVDTVLLSSALLLAVTLNLSPLETPWLAAKLCALLVYIGLGSLAIRPTRPKPQRLAAWLAAQLVFGYMVGVALSHDPQPWRAALSGLT